MSAYYTNSLESWRNELLADQRRGMRRYEIMAAQKHPDMSDQMRLLSLRTSILGLIESALAEEKSEE